MKKKSLTLLVVLAAAPFVYADYYKLNLTRIGQDRYRETSTRMLIETRYCYEYVSYEDVIASWDVSRPNEGTLFFDNGSTCEISAVKDGK